MFEGVFLENPQWSLATFNLAYNVIYTLILLVFLDPLVGLVKKIIKDKKPKTKKMHYIDDRLLATPLVAIGQALKEVSNMAVMAQDNFSLAFDGLIQGDLSQSKKIADTEYQVDHITRGLVDYFIKISSTSISGNHEKLIAGLHHVVDGIERISDYAVELAKETNYMQRWDARFIKETKGELQEIHLKISEMFSLGLESFNTRKTEHLEQISEIHMEITELITATRDAHITRLSSNMYSIEVSKSLYAVLFSLQRVADHIVNIAFSIRSDTGSKTEALESMKRDRRNRKV
jgi:phosphate:Na+ symporter